MAQALPAHKCRWDHRRRVSRGRVRGAERRQPRSPSDPPVPPSRSLSPDSRCSSNGVAAIGGCIFAPASGINGQLDPPSILRMVVFTLEKVTGSAGHRNHFCDRPRYVSAVSQESGGRDPLTCVKHCQHIRARVTGPRERAVPPPRSPRLAHASSLPMRITMRITGERDAPRPAFRSVGAIPGARAPFRS